MAVLEISPLRNPKYSGYGQRAALVPDVIIIHPRRARDWRNVFHTWTRDSAAERFTNHVLAKVLPEHYTLDGTYPSIYFADQGAIDVYAKKREDP